MNRKKSGFSLVEVVISLALGGMILTAVMSLFSSFVQVWSVKKTPYQLFVDHVDNCVRFLQARLNNVIPIVANKKVEKQYAHCVKISTRDKLQGEAWSLGLWEREALPFLRENYDISVCVLARMGENLCLVIEHPQKVERRMGEGIEVSQEVVRQYIVLSPFVTRIEYGHRDPVRGQWQFIQSFEAYCKQFGDKNFQQRPEGLFLTFKKDEFEEKRFIAFNHIMGPTQPISQKEWRNEKSR